MAATTISARRRTSGRSRVLEWQIVTVALACMKRRDMGLPTMAVRARAAGRGLADEVAAAEDDGVGAFDLDFVAAQNFHAAGGSAGDQAGASADEAAKGDGTTPRHVFWRIAGSNG